MTASSIYFQSFPYAITKDTNLIDYQALSEQAKVFKPRLIICGASAYPRDWDYAGLRKTADREGAWLMCDMAHTSGLVAAQELNSPFEYCDVVTTTTCIPFYSYPCYIVKLTSFNLGTRHFVALVLV
jgi:glycine hydroxymethyltransferase